MEKKKEKQSPDLHDAQGAARRMLASHSPLFAATAGLDGRPQLRPAVFAFEQYGVLYFMTVKSSRMYAELCRSSVSRSLKQHAFSAFPQRSALRKTSP